MLARSRIARRAGFDARVHHGARPVDRCGDGGGDRDLGVDPAAHERVDGHGPDATAGPGEVAGRDEGGPPRPGRGASASTAATSAAVMCVFTTSTSRGETTDRACDLLRARGRQVGDTDARRGPDACAGGSPPMTVTSWPSAACVRASRSTNCSTPEKPSERMACRIRSRSLAGVPASLGLERAREREVACRHFAPGVLLGGAPRTLAPGVERLAVEFGESVADRSGIALDEEPVLAVDDEVGRESHTGRRRPGVRRRAPRARRARSPRRRWAAPADRMPRGRGRGCRACPRNARARRRRPAAPGLRPPDHVG